MNQPVSAIDFFCGAGGLTCGLIEADIKVLAGLDNDETVRRTYEENNSVRFFNQDLGAQEELQTAIPEEGFLLFAGCAPCQPFSNLNHNRVDTGSESLLNSFYWYIEKYRPDFVFSENVPQLSKRKVFRSFTANLKKLGYRIDSAILRFDEYGVPQRRRRLLLLACLHTEVRVPAAPAIRKSVRQTIKGFPPLSAGERHDGKDYLNHISSGLSPLNQKRIEATPVDGGDSRSWPDSLKPPSRVKQSEAYYDAYGRMRWDDPAPTLTTRCNSLSSGRFGHPQENRAISMREAAALQTFRNDYEFFGSIRQVAKHIGNAVPPLIASVVGREICRIASNLSVAGLRPDRDRVRAISPPDSISLL